MAHFSIWVPCNHTISRKPLFPFSKLSFSSSFLSFSENPIFRSTLSNSNFISRRDVGEAQGFCFWSSFAMKYADALASIKVCEGVPLIVCKMNLQSSMRALNWLEWSLSCLKRNPRSRGVVLSKVFNPLVLLFLHRKETEVTFIFNVDHPKSFHHFWSSIR